MKNTVNELDMLISLLNDIGKEPNVRDVEFSYIKNIDNEGRLELRVYYIYPKSMLAHSGIKNILVITSDREEKNKHIYREAAKRLLTYAMFAKDYEGAINIHGVAVETKSMRTIFKLDLEADYGKRI